MAYHTLSPQLALYFTDIMVILYTSVSTPKALNRGVTEVATLEHGYYLCKIV